MWCIFYTVPRFVVYGRDGIRTESRAGSTPAAPTIAQLTNAGRTR